MMAEHEVSDSSDEGEDHSVPMTTEEMLSQLVDDVSEYKVLKEPGPVTVQHITPSTELYLITIPTDMFDPMKLIHTELVVGSNKERAVKVGEQEFQMITYPITSQAQPPSLFVPNKDGFLQRVDDDLLKGHIVFQSQPQSKEGLKRINIQSLFSKQHEPPSDLRPRNFFASTSKPRGTARKPIEREGKAKKKKREVVKEEVEEVESPQIKKKKKMKKTNADTSLPSSITDIKQEETQTPKKRYKKLSSPIAIKEELMSLNQESKKSKKLGKSKKEAESKLASPIKVKGEFMSLSQETKKSKKPEKSKKGVESEEESHSQQSKMVKKEKNKIKLNKSVQEEMESDEKCQLSDDLFAESPKKKKSKKGKLNLTV